MSLKIREFPEVVRGTYLPGYLIRFAPPAFAPHRRARSSRPPSPLVVLPGLTDFAPTPGVPPASPAP